MRFVNLDRQYRAFKPELDEAYHRVMNSGQYILGEEVEAFEEEWAAYCGVKNCVGVASGLDALVLALKAYNVGYHDEVIVPSNTYIATWIAVSLVGASVKPVEPDMDYCISAAGMKNAITERTKAIIPVHLYGHVCHMESIMKFAKKHKLRVIVDSAQAHGAKHQGQNIAQWGDVNCWSFYPTKNLGAHGDAGAVTTNNDLIARRIRTLRSYGEVRKYHNVEIGHNSRLDPLQAAFLRVKIPYLDLMNKQRQRIADEYRHAIIHRSRSPMWGLDRPVYHQYVIEHKARDKIGLRLQSWGVPTMIHYPIPPHKSEAYMSDIQLPIAERLADEVLSLPIDPFLYDHEIAMVLHGLSNISWKHQ